MTFSDYLIDAALVLLVLLQIKERPVTTKQLVRPLIIVGAAVWIYLDGVPTAGNDLVLAGLFGLVGASIGLASGWAAIMRRGADGVVLSRSGWLSAALWVAGMGSRFAFVVWITHGGVGPVARFSAAHDITSQEAWTVALLAMAVCEVLGRTAVIALRRRALSGARPLVPAV
jgi:hypothetical protein